MRLDLFPVNTVTICLGYYSYTAAASLYTYTAEIQGKENSD